VRSKRQIEPRLEPFRARLVELRREGEVVGHIATRVRSFWSPFSFRRNECVWFTIIWADGRRENPFEDYAPPWPTIEQLEHGRFIWDRGAHQGEYDAEMLDTDRALVVWRALGITPGVL
jgi:hypothetical protein